MLTDIRALADRFLIALPNINKQEDPDTEAEAQVEDPAEAQE